jgi:hypothetical protein
MEGLGGNLWAMYPKNVMSRRIVALILVSAWALALPLACLPNAAMTSVEMECCKKMAGNCDMGGGNHKCCDTKINHTAPSLAVVHSPVPDDPAPVIIPNTYVDALQLALFSRAVPSSVTLSPSPPGIPTVLRI